MLLETLRMNRRDFIKRAGAALTWLALPPAFPIPDWPCGKQVFDPPPTQFGRIATWWRQAVHTEARQESEQVAWFTRDEIIPLYATVMGKAPWPNNPVWYQTEDGFIHSGYVQPVEDTPSSETITEVADPGFWAQVCVPIAKARWKPDSTYVRYKLYYGTVYRVIDAVQDEAGEWWYQLQDGVTFAPGPYVPTWSVRRIPPEEMTSISPGHPDKRIEISIETQTLTCFEGENAVFQTGISSGAGGTTPRGEHRVLYKRHTRRMVGGSGDDYYDLPGISFPVYFTRNAVAIHGTYWHNDFVRPHSHGCVNVTNQAAQWVFRWAEPMVPYDEYEKKAKSEEGTPITVI